jgi:LPS-assembly protein
VRYGNYFILFILLSNSFAAIAEEKKEFALCKPFNKIAPPRPNIPPLEDDLVHLSADQATVQEKLGISTFRGNVLMQRADQLLKTPVMVYDRQKQTIETEQAFTFWDKDYVIKGDKLQLRPENEGEMNNTQYWLLNRRARGDAKKLTKASQDKINLEQASYTTCDPKHEIWRLQADRVTLDTAKDQGTARDVSIRLLNTPVFYFPYFSFPLGDQRKSGFLVPRIGRSDQAGFEFSIPYYLNLAPHYDATITPHVMSRRGVLLNNEFRYLTQSSKGKLEVEYLPYDSILKEQRSSVAFKHTGQFNPRWITDINLNYVSDKQYFEELGTHINLMNLTHLEQRADLLYYGDGWVGLGRLQNFQTLDNNPYAHPYQRLPQFLFKTTLPEINRSLNIGIQAEAVRFDRETKIVDAPIGNRFDIQPSVSLPWRTPGTFIVPKLSLRYTTYNLDNVKESADSTPQRTLFTFSTDSGLFFDRDLKLGNSDLVQTLEPRLYYRYTPYKDQSDIPIFDSAEYDLSFLQLFRDNRYLGGDRVDDGHQLSLGVSSRFLDNRAGTEHLRASIGQTYYFRDRRVTLPNQEIETASTSSLVMELAAQLSQDLRATTTLYWDPDTQNTEHSVVRMRYQPARNNIFNFSYRLRDEILEQTDLSFHWALNPRWNLLGRYNYSLEDKMPLDTILGFEYNSCCWAVRLIGRRYLNIDDSNHSDSIFLEFQLKGLGTIGQKADSFLEERIPGYHK